MTSFNTDAPQVHMKWCKSYRKALCAVLKCGPRQRFVEPLADPWLTDLGESWCDNVTLTLELFKLQLWLGLKGDKKWEKMCSRTVDCTFIHLAAHYASFGCASAVFGILHKNSCSVYDDRTIDLKLQKWFEVHNLLIVNCQCQKVTFFHIAWCHHIMSCQLFQWLGILLISAFHGLLAE